MKKKKFLVPVVTPFHQDESINYSELKKLVKKVLVNGADGIYAGGASSEFVLLTNEERKKVLETIIRAADGAYVAAHIGAGSTAEAIDLAKHAKYAGADCIASVPPYWYNYTFDEIKQYFISISEAGGLPVIVYNIPQVSKIKFTKEEFYKLFSDEKIFAVKFTDNDYFQLERIKTKTNAFVYSGSDECFLSALAAGADGAIGTTFNFMMDKYISIYESFQNGNFNKAKETMQRANNITEEVLKKFCLLGTKYLLTLQGIEAGNCRKPFGVLNDEEKYTLKKVYENNN